MIPSSQSRRAEGEQRTSQDSQAGHLLTTFPPDLKAFADFADSQPPQVRAIFQYALAKMLVDAERAHVIGKRTVDGTDELKLRTITGDEFEVVNSNLSPELDLALREQVWAIYEEEQQ